MPDSIPLRSRPSTSQSRPLRLFISTGEVSGDLQGALLIQALQTQAQRQDIELEITALGGKRMATTGATLLADTTRLGSVGIVESLPYVIPTLQVQRQVKRSLLQDPPDAVILIDYRGPNLSLGNFLRQRLPDLSMIYYIAPQEWVWSVGSRNTTEIAPFTTLLLAIFPGESAYFQARGVPTQWVGHPLLDLMQSNPSRHQARQQLGIADSELAIALLPASRKQEVRYLLPPILEAAQRMQSDLLAQGKITPEQTLFWIPLSLESYRADLEAQLIRYGLQAQIVPTANANDPDWDRRCALAAADLAITKSGTVNLELALMQVPQVVLYRVSPVTAWIARRLLKFSIPFMSPVNLVEMKAVVPELLQEDASSERIYQESMALLLDGQRRQAVLQGYKEVRQALGELGACDRAAATILKVAQQAFQSGNSG